MFMDRRSFLAGVAALPLAVAVAKLKPIQEILIVEPRLSASMWIYLWDLVDEGYDDVLLRLKENDLTSISLATAYHTGKFLEPHNPKRKVVFLEDGTVYYSPNAKLYGRIAPIVNSLVNDGHGLREAKEHADRFGMQTRSWVVCCHNTALGMRYPEITCETAFGDKLFHNLCPSNNDVRIYLGALVRDIASHGVDAIELEALQFQGYSHGYHHEREGIPLNSGMKFLLGLCFCPSCAQRAHDVHVDFAAVRKFTRDTLETHFANPSKFGDQYSDVEKLPQQIFGPLFEWRTSVITSFVKELAEATNSFHVKLRPMISLDPSVQKMAGIDVGRIAEITGGVLALGYVKDGAALRPPLSMLQSQIPGKTLTAGFQLGLPESGGKVEFLDRMKVARELGISSYNFYNYGLVPQENLSWIKESLSG
jgi:hypothetical protein